MWNYIKNKKWVILIIMAIVGTVIYMSGNNVKQDSAKYASMPISRGNLRQIVTATGEIRPVNTILVGSQVSGNIEKIYVDYNDKVKKGQILLKIEPSVLKASVNEAKATLDSAISQLEFDRAEYKRDQDLFANGFIARAEMEKSKTQFNTSEQSVKRARSQYDRAVTNLGYATITSPADGTIISRKVDEGQTVAANFQTPDLFELAEDLSKMQIETAISEADIGLIKVGQTVSFTVDAYPTQTFEGSVKQIRLSPTTTQNVVVYTVIINVDNTDLRLMPGMTAFVTVLVAEKENVWKAANSAFLVRSYKAVLDDLNIKNDKITPKEYLIIERSGKKSEIKIIPYKKGLITATETEIIADGLQDGDKIIIGKLGGVSTGSSMSHGGGPMGGGPD